MIGRILNRLKSKQLRIAPPLLAARLRLESLEGRDNPAYYWDPLSGGNLLATNPLNWTKDGSGGSMVRCTSVEVPTNPTDNLVFGAYIPQTTLYQYGQPPQTIPAHWSTADCILTQQYSSGVANFRGLTLLSTYPGEVDLRQSANVESLDVRAGKIKQNDPATVGSGNAGTLTVTQGLFWSGGTLNSNTVAGLVNLAPGANGTAAPTDGGTVNLGSTFTLLGGETQGSLLDIYKGTFNINNGHGFVVEDHSLVNFNAPVPGSIADPPTIDVAITINGQPQTPDEDGTLHVKRGGICEIQADNRPSGNDNFAKVEFKGSSAILLNDGSVYIKDRSWLKFNPDAGTTGGYRQTVAGAAITPRTIIQAGSKITGTGQANVRVLQGTFCLEPLFANGQPVSIQPAVTIDTAGPTTAMILGANATLTQDSPVGVPVTLKITGAATQSLQCDGTLELYAVKSAYSNDKILADGRVVFGGAAKIKMKWFDNNGSLPPSGDWWTLVESDYPDPNSTSAPISGNPTFVYPPLNSPFELLIPGLSSDNKKYQVSPNS